MDNQHKHIKGYRDLNKDEIALMNEGKELAEQCRVYIEKLENTSAAPEANIPSAPDSRWVNIAKDHLQQGFMAAVRSIAKPTTF